VQKELDLKRVTFEFEDGTKRILEDDELSQWMVLCYMQSDYLLPGNSTHVLASGFGGLVQGFMPPEVVNRPKQ